jgi:hypothetical protein
MKSQEVGQNCIKLVLFSKYIRNQVKIHEMSRECSTNFAERNTYRMLVGKLKERYHWEDQCVGGWTIVK